MGQSIAVMNTKGGVGKSTVVMALAETLSVFNRLNVLVIDSDMQTSISVMLMPTDRWEAIEAQQKTLVHYLGSAVLGGGDTDWKEFVVTQVSDVDEADTVYLIPSHMELSLFEREVSEKGKTAELNQRVRALLDDAKRYFDVVLIDCPPGISILTEAWLRECDYHLPPVKPDYLSVRGYGVLGQFKSRSQDKRFSENLGLLINMKDGRIRSEEEYHSRLAGDAANRCFQAAIPRRAYIQRAADFDPSTRTYAAKYPGDAGQAIRQVAQEVVARLAAGQLAAQSAKPVPPPAPPAPTIAPVVMQPQPAKTSQPASGSAASTSAPLNGAMSRTT